MYIIHECLVALLWFNSTQIPPHTTKPQAMNINLICTVHKRENKNHIALIYKVLTTMYIGNVVLGSKFMSTSTGNIFSFQTSVKIRS